MKSPTASAGPGPNGRRGGGGRGPEWAGGGGSSMERIDSRADSSAPNGAASDETQKAPWTLVSAKGKIDNGRTSSIQPDQLQILLQGRGECLLDDVQVLDANGTNRIANSSFESGGA